MTTLVNSEERLSGSGELKLEMIKDGASPAAFKPEKVIKSILGNSANSDSAERLLSREIEVLTDIDSDLPVGDEEQPSANLLWEGWLGGESEGSSSIMASSCNSEAILLEENGFSKSRSAPPAPPRNKLKESWSSARDGFPELRSSKTNPHEKSWKQFQQFAVRSASQTLSRTETPPNNLSRVTDKIAKNKSRLLGVSSGVLGAASLGASVGGPVGITVAAGIGLGASGVNFVAGEAGRKFEKSIEELDAKIKELDEKILRALEAAPSADEMSELMRQRELLGKERDQTIENRKIALGVERGASIAGLVNLGASLTALPGALISAGDAISSAGNLLTVYGGVSDIKATIEESVFGSKSEGKSPVEE